MKKKEKFWLNTRVSETNTKLNLYDRLKILAVLTMIIDYLWFFIFPQYLEMRLIGRFAFPIFLFLVGFNWKYHRKWSLCLAAIGIQVLFICFDLQTGFHISQTGNILIVIILVRLLLHGLDKLCKHISTTSKEKQKTWIFISFIVLTLLSILVLNKSPISMNLAKWLDYWLLGFIFGLAWFFAKKTTVHPFFLALSLIGIFGVHTKETLNIFLFPPWWMQMVLIVGFGISVTGFTFLQHDKTQNYTLALPKLLNQILAFISRKALWIYVLHLIILLLWKYLLIFHNSLFS